MFDKNLLFSDDATITADGFGTAVAVNKCPPEGVDIEVAVNSSTGDTETLDVTVYEANATPTAGSQVLATFPQITGVGRYFRRVHTKMKYLSLHYNIGGTSAEMVVQAGIVSGRQPDAVR